MLLALSAIFVGAALQRVSGIGFAMVVAPFVVIALGPGQGVVLVQLCGLTTAALVLARIARHVDWGAYRALLPASLVGIAVGSLAISRLPAAPAQVVTASILVLAMAATTFVGTAQLRRSPVLMSTAGSLAGIMTTTAGVGGVALTILGRLTGWEQHRFAATLQPYFFSISAATVIVRVGLDRTAWPELSGGSWAAVGIALAAGLVLGELVAARMSARAAGIVVLTISWVGALLSLADGLRAL